MTVQPLGGQLIAKQPSHTENTPHGDDKSKLKKACHEMEGYFVGMLLKQMHESAMKGGLFEEKSESATYRDMFDDAVANEIGKRGSFGIADTLYKTLSRQFDAEVPTNRDSPTVKAPAVGPTAAEQTEAGQTAPVHAEVTR